MDLILVGLMFLGVIVYLLSQSYLQRVYQVGPRLRGGMFACVSLYLIGGTGVALCLYTFVIQSAVGAAVVVLGVSLVALFYAIPTGASVMEVHHEWLEERPKKILRQLADE
jgi:hypothetical protein